MDFTTKLSALAARVEAGLESLVPPPDTRPARLHEAMDYSLKAGGKRLRPVMTLAAAELFDPSAARNPLAAAVAIECVHTYSLIHDDLPCMDNDDFRRGRPTLHRAFDEATALLAGDALLTHAFALLSNEYAEEPRLAAALVGDLAAAAGSRQLIGGQMEDLLAEKRKDITASDVDFIHLNKTAAMIEAALVMGARVGGAAPAALATLREAGRELGLAFQIIDDVLDVTADSQTLGKTAGKDAKSGKATYVSLHGIDVSRRVAAEKSAAAASRLASLPGDTGFLSALARELIHRKK